MNGIKRAAPRVAFAITGIVAACISLVVLGEARIQRKCGHRQVLGSFLLGKLGLGNASHDETEAAAERWKLGRTPEAFQQISEHLSQGASKGSVLALLGKPDTSVHVPPHAPGHAARVQVDWIYDLGGGSDRRVGKVWIDEIDEVVIGFQLSSPVHKRCLSAGTPVLAEMGEVAVEALRPGDRVWGYDLLRRERVLTRVRAVRESFAAETVVLGDSLRVTASHPVLVSGVWKPAGEVRGGDLLLGADGKDRLLQHRAPMTGLARVFDIEVESPHDFFAGGFLVHNKTLREAK
jgi:hypothetical protein